MTVNDGLLTVKEVALMLRLTPASVYRAAKAGRLPHVVVIKGERRDIIRFRKAEIEALLSHREAQ